MDKKIAVLLDGDMGTTDALRAKLTNSFVIAADGGIRHAEALDLKPDLWVGDFDSVADTEKSKFTHVERVSFPTDKAKSDGELAMEIAIKRAPEIIYVCGAIGGDRFDHALMNIALILKCAHENPNICIQMLQGTQTLLPILPNQALKIDAPSGTILSLNAFSDLKGLSISGVRWPLEQVDIEFGSTLTLSNEIEQDAVIYLDDGHAIAIVQNKT